MPINEKYSLPISRGRILKLPAFWNAATLRSDSPDWRASFTHEWSIPLRVPAWNLSPQLERAVIHLQYEWSAGMFHSRSPSVDHILTIPSLDPDRKRNRLSPNTLVSNIWRPWMSSLWAFEILFLSRTQGASSAKLTFERPFTISAYAMSKL